MNINENIFLFATNIFVFVLCGGMFMIVPHLTRKSLLFGVKIPQEQANCSEAVAMKRQYVITCLLGSLVILALCILQFLLVPQWTLMATMYLWILIIPVYFIAFVPNWKKAVLLKEAKGWQVSNVVFAETRASHTRGNLHALPWGWYIASFVIIIATIVLAMARYPHLPDMIPGHMDANMQATRYVPKTVVSVLMMPLINAAMLLIMLLAGVTIEKAKLQMDQNSPHTSFMQHRAYRKRMGNAMGFFTLATMVLVGIVGIPIIFNVPPQVGINLFWGSMILIAVPLVLLIAVQVKTGQGGCRVKIELSEDNLEDTEQQATASETSKAVGRGDDKYWKLGMFYYNPDDPAIIVENRFGTNIGFNYGRLPVQIGAVLSGVAFVVMYVWLTVVLIGM